MYCLITEIEADEILLALQGLQLSLRSVAVCSCVFRILVHGSTWLVNTKIQEDKCTAQRYCLKEGTIHVQSVCLIINNMGQQVNLPSVAGMRF